MKNSILRVISGILFPIIFVALFFIIGGSDHGATCWIGFGSILLVYAVIVASTLLIPNTQSSYLFGATGSVVTGIFFTVQFIVGMVFMIGDFENWKVPIIIEIVLIAVMIFLLLQLHQADEATAQKENKQQGEAYSVKIFVVKTQMIINRTSDSEIKRCVKNVYDELNSCQTSGNPKVKSLDDSISYSLDALNQAVMSNNIESVKSAADAVIKLAKERKMLSR